MIIFASFVSRYRNKDKEQESEDAAAGKVKFDRSLRLHQAMERLDFATKSVDQQKKAHDDYE